MTQEEFSSSVLIENQQIKKQLAEYHHACGSTDQPPASEGKQLDSPVQPGGFAVVPSALDCGILVPNEKMSSDGFAPIGARGPVLSRPALAPPSQPRGKAPGGSGRRGRRGSAGGIRGGRGAQQQQAQPQQPARSPQSSLDCAILVPSGETAAPHLLVARRIVCISAARASACDQLGADAPSCCMVCIPWSGCSALAVYNRGDGGQYPTGSCGIRRHAGGLVEPAVFESRDGSEISERSRSRSGAGLTAAQIEGTVRSSL